MLDYLDFEISDDGEGITTFDAMAYATAERWPALQTEVTQVLAWCTQEFGAPGPLDSGKLWDLDVQLQSDASHALACRWDGAARVLAAPAAAHCSAVQLSLTISVQESLTLAFEQQFLSSDM